MPLNKRQQEAYDVFKNNVLGNSLPQKKELIFVGGTGSGKTFYNCGLVHMMASNFGGSKWAVIRKTDANLKRNTIPSYKKAVEALGGNPKELPIVDMVMRYPNGSEVLFLWSNTEKDFDALNLKGLEVTGCLFDELDQLAPKAYNTMKTRIGRNNKGLISMKTGKKVDLPAFMLASCNPNASWVKAEFYDKFMDGTLDDHVYFIESYPQDNIENLGDDYIKVLETLPEEEKNRYLYAKWDYVSDPSILIQFAWIKECIEPKKDGFELDGEVHLSIDVADCGSDNTVFGLERGDVVFEIQDFNGLDTVGIVKKALEFCKKFNIPKTGGIIVDAVGVGAGVVSMLNDKGYNVAAFKGNMKPEKNKPREVVDGSGESKIKELTFKDKNAQSAWLLREDIKNQKITLFDCKALTTEMSALRYDSDDKNIILEKKKDFKKRFGRSPDFADCIRMLNYLRNGYCIKKPRRVRAFTI